MIVFDFNDINDCVDCNVINHLTTYKYQQDMAFPGTAIWIKYECPLFGYWSCKTIGEQKCYVLLRPCTVIPTFYLLKKSISSTS